MANGLQRFQTDKQIGLKCMNPYSVALDFETVCEPSFWKCSFGCAFQLQLKMCRVSGFAPDLLLLLLLISCCYCRGGLLLACCSIAGADLLMLLLVCSWVAGLRLVCCCCCRRRCCCSCCCAAAAPAFACAACWSAGLLVTGLLLVCLSAAVDAALALPPQAHTHTHTLLNICS